MGPFARSVWLGRHRQLLAQLRGQYVYHALQVHTRFLQALLSALHARQVLTQERLGLLRVLRVKCATLVLIA